MNEYKCIVCSGNMKYFFEGTDFILKTTDKTFKLYKCKKCGLEMILPQPKFDEISNFYPTDYYSYQSNNIDESQGWYDKMLIKLLDKSYSKKSKRYDGVLKKFFFGFPFYYVGNKNFLDIGCGNGQKLRLMSKYGWDTYGFEIGEKGFRNNIFYDNSIVNVDFGEIKFDFINISHVLEHIDNPITFLEKVYCILDEDGTINLSIPNTDGILCKLFKKTPTFMRDIPRHLINYNKENIKYLFEKMGFKIIEKKTLLGQFFSSSLVFYFKSKFNIDIGFIQRNIIFRGVLFFFEFMFWVLQIGDHIGFIIKKKYEK